MDNTPPFLLTHYSRGSGCGCKISPAALKEILRGHEALPNDPRILVGSESNDDAAVIELPDGNCLISTTDFFMPVVDDAGDFGKIAAANALSDIYAMGGKPLLAIAILGWPIDKLPAGLANEVLEGARLTCRMAGITLAGGHSVDSVEPFFGLSVNGLVAKKQIKRNHTIQEGDFLYLTKPLGLGMITAAAKRGLATDGDIGLAISWMCRLNQVGSALSELSGVHAMTDVTGFGLLGHLLEMTGESDLAAMIDAGSLPLMPGLQGYIDRFIYPDMTMKNFSSFSGRVNELDLRQLLIMCDPQTSGGLLISVGGDATGKVEEVLRQFAVPDFCIRPVGRIVRNETFEVVVTG